MRGDTSEVEYSSGVNISDINKVFTHKMIRVVRITIILTLSRISAYISGYFEDDQERKLKNRLIYTFIFRIMFVQNKNFLTNNHSIIKSLFYMKSITIFM